MMEAAEHVSPNSPSFPASSLAMRLLCEGVQVSPESIEELRRTGHWVASPSGSARLELELGGGAAPLLVSVRTSEAHEGGLLLAREKGAWMLRAGGSMQRVAVPPPPSFYQDETASGRRMGSLACKLGSTLLFLPDKSCGYGLSGASCRFCRVGSRAFEETRVPLTASETAQVVAAAERSGPLRHIYFPALPSFDLDDGGVADLEPLVRAARRHSSALLAASLHPPRLLRWLDHAYAMGIDAVGLHLEILDVEVLSRLLPGRARHFGKSRYLAALRHAARIFPRGAVWSEVVVGWEPLSSLPTSLAALLAIGVVPVLVPQRQDERLTALPATPPSAAELEAVVEQLRARLREERLCYPWFPALAYAASVQEEKAAALPRGPLPGFFSGVSLRSVEFALRYVARIRRALRVNSLDDSSSEPASAGH